MDLDWLSMIDRTLQLLFMKIYFLSCFKTFDQKNCLEEIFMSLFHIPFKCIRYSCISSYFSTTHKHAHFVMRPLSSKFKFSLKFAPWGFSLSNCILNWSQLRERKRLKTTHWLLSFKVDDGFYRLFPIFEMTAWLVIAAASYSPYFSEGLTKLLPLLNLIA